jgi:outer membrane protein TolC
MFSTVFAHCVSAQDSTRHLTLIDAIETALRSNRSIRLSQLDQNIAATKYRQTEAIFLPQATLSYAIMNTDNPLNAFGSKMQQRAITQNDFNPDLLTHPSSVPDYTAKLEIEQSLINLPLLYMRKGAEKQTEGYQYQTKRIQEFVTFQVKKAYLQLQLAYGALKILTEATRTAKSVFTYTDDHFRQGLVQKSDLLNAHVHVTSVESSLAKAQSNIKNASDYLGILMGEPNGIIYKADSETPLAIPIQDTAQKVVEQRSDFIGMQKAIEASGLMIKSSEKSYLPKLNAFINYQSNDHHFASFGSVAYLAGLQLSWNVFNGNKTKHVIAEQRLERDKLVIQLAQQKEQSQLELDKAYRDLSDARFEIEHEKAAIEQAAEALRIILNRYKQGLVNTTDVLTADTQLSQLEFSLAQAQFTANITRAYIELLTSTTK